jgi:asparagine synthase (glutamine-hydrolysing)
MCGINGIYTKAPAKSEFTDVIHRMNTTIAHRGPDDSGIFSNEHVVLGHTRLSIIDTSSAGHQPMSTENGRYTIVFNGEIYNYKELRKRFSAHYSFKTGSDTEVILAGFERIGISILHELKGIFAFAIWDTQLRQLHICRDHLGVKQVYYAQTPAGDLVFSSELRALLTSRLVQPQLNYDALCDFLRFQRVHAPQTIVQDVQVILPGHFLSVNESGVQMTKYYDVSAVSCDRDIQRREAVHQVRRLLENSVEEQMVADVEVGAFLSGGVDSSVVVGLMSKVSPQRVHTFSVTFRNPQFDESRYSQLVAKHFNTRHQQIELEPEELLHALPHALEAMDHPTADGINTYLVSKKTRETGIKVALSGLGGDELFGGYPVFKMAQQAAKWQFAQHLISSPFTRVALHTMYKLTGKTALLKVANIVGRGNSWVANLLEVSRQTFTDEEVKHMLNRKHLPDGRVQEWTRFLSAQQQSDTISKVSLFELNTYLTDTLLRDTDQMSMAHALEVRVPFLDHQLVHYVLGLSDELKNGKYAKQLLIESTRDILPSEVYNRKKMGFVLPWNQWMKKDLKPFCEERIQRFASRSFTNAQAVELVWQKFLQGNPAVNWSRVWQLVVMEDWLTRNGIHE